MNRISPQAYPPVGFSGTGTTLAERPVATASVFRPPVFVYKDTAQFSYHSDAEKEAQMKAKQALRDKQTVQTTEFNRIKQRLDSWGKKLSLQGINLSHRDLSGCNFEGADLTGASLERVNLRGANLKGANLVGTELYKADLTGANLEGATLVGTFLEGANLEGADLRETNLAGAVLREARLKGAKLKGSNLEGTTLTDTIFDPNKTTVK